MSHLSRRVPAALALLIAVLALAACGSSDTKEANRYVGQVNEIQNDVAAKFRAAGAAISPTATTEANDKALQQFDAAVTSAVARLKGVDAPDKVAALHARLVQAVDGYHASIAAARRALRAKNQAALTRAQTAFSAGTTKISALITTTIEAINGKLH